MSNAKHFKEQNSALAEIDDIMGKVDRGEITLAQADERMMAIAAQQERDTLRRIEALKEQGAASRRKALLVFLLTALVVCAAIAFIAFN
jgi:DNA-binding transcriptional MerR regulator